MKHQLLTADKMLTLARHPGRHSDILSERRRRQDSLKSIRELTAQKKKKNHLLISGERMLPSLADSFYSCLIPLHLTMYTYDTYM